MSFVWKDGGEEAAAAVRNGTIEREREVKIPLLLPLFLKVKRRPVCNLCLLCWQDWVTERWVHAKIGDHLPPYFMRPREWGSVNNLWLIIKKTNKQQTCHFFELNLRRTVGLASSSRSFFFLFLPLYLAPWGLCYVNADGCSRFTVIFFFICQRREIKGEWRGVAVVLSVRLSVTNKPPHCTAAIFRVPHLHLQASTSSRLLKVYAFSLGPRRCEIKMLDTLLDTIS